jgi:beta-glucosidase/6-phospho-beta-glucosidase/beta-galactosidase
VNYYHDHLMVADRSGTNGNAFPGTGAWSIDAPDGRRTSMGWPETPHGLTDLLLWLQDRYPNLPPLYITENGCAFDDPLVDGEIHDDRRIEYFDEHLQATADAIRSGVDVRGHFAWSFLDNFEWAEGYGQRFGLVHVDFETLQRTPRQSAHWWAEVAGANGERPS